MTDKELMQQALEALEKHVLEYETVEALRARLAQPEPEELARLEQAMIEAWKPIPQREWQGLTDEDIEKIHYDIKCKGMGAYSTNDIYRAIEAKLKEKNT